MVECLFLYAVMLLELDMRIEGVVRERLLVTYRRWKGPKAVFANFQDICRLCAQTGYSRDNSTRKVSHYPVEYFGRFPFPARFVAMVIGRLRTDDIYNQMIRYPHPDDRSTALATQASMLYVVLYFAPDVLHNDGAKMREIVDRYFPDNWVTCYYMGTVVDVAAQWKDFKAARQALANTIDTTNRKRVQARVLERCHSISLELKERLTEGLLTDEYLLQNVSPLMTMVREANVVLRWMFLHTNEHQQAIADLLIDLAQFEYVFKNSYSRVLANKDSLWNEYKQQSFDRIHELAEYFSGEKALTKVERNENLQSWFTRISQQIYSLAYTDATVAGRLLVQLRTALDEVEMFHQLENSLQARVYISETRIFLGNMLRLLNAKDDTLVTLSIVSDFAYSWELIPVYVKIFQQAIQTQPSMVIKLRAVFLKLTSVLDFPLVRINEAGSPDLVSVSSLYSSKLVEFVEHVLSIIPRAMFVLIGRIMKLQTALSLYPTRFEKADVEQFVQGEERLQMARYIRDVSALSAALLAMEKTLVGVVEVDPKNILDTGLRRELSATLSQYLNTTLQFSAKEKSADLIPRLLHVLSTSESFRTCFGMIQDFVVVNTAKIWHQEHSRLLLYSTEQAIDTIETVTAGDSLELQNEEVPLPKQLVFMGNVLSELTRITHASNAIYVRKTVSWYERKTLIECFTPRDLRTVGASLGPVGLYGLSKIAGYQVRKGLTELIVKLNSYLISKDEMGQQFREVFAPTMKALGDYNSIPPQYDQIYGIMKTRLAKMLSGYDAVTKLCEIGQMQLVRSKLNHELAFLTKADHQILSRSIANVELASLIEDSESEINLRLQVTQLSESTGIGQEETLEQIYVTSHDVGGEVSSNFAKLLFVILLNSMSRFIYEPRIDSLIASTKKDPVDGVSFVFGVATLLKQLDTRLSQTLFQLTGQYIRAQFNASPDPKLLASDTLNILHWLEILRISAPNFLAVHLPEIPGQ